MTAYTKELSAWILAALLVGTVLYEEARFGRRHTDRPSFQTPAGEISAPTPLDSESNVTIAEFNQTGSPD